MLEQVDETVGIDGGALLAVRPIGEQVSDDHPSAATCLRSSVLYSVSARGCMGRCWACGGPESRTPHAFHHVPEVCATGEEPWAWRRL
jgi:hypothetical protein